MTPANPTPDWDQQILDVLPVGVIITGPAAEDTPILYVNRAFEQLTGYRFDQVRHRNPRLLQPSSMTPQQQQARRNLRNAIHSGTECKGRILNRRRDGTEYWAEMCVVPLGDRQPGKPPIGFAAVQLDVTARVTAERRIHELLHSTVIQIIDVLVKTLSHANPTAAAYSNRLGRLSSITAEQWPGIRPWVLTAAARLSCLGWIGTDPSILARHQQGEALPDTERAMVDDYPGRGADLIQSIPHMSDVADAIRWHRADFAPPTTPAAAPHGHQIPIAARVLRILQDLDQLVVHDRQKLTDTPAALARHPHAYDPDLLNHLPSLLPSLAAEGWTERWERSSVTPDQLMTGMILDQDIHDARGRLLIRKGHDITPVLLQRLRVLAKDAEIQPQIEIVRRTRRAT